MPEESVNPEQSILEDAVNLHYKRVYHFALRIARNAEDAADLTQHAYEKLAKSPQQVKDPSKVRAWLQSTVYRKFIDQKRRIIKFPQVELAEEHVAPQENREKPGNQVDAQLAREALDKLEDDLRIPLSLFYLNSCSYKEIAKTLDLPVGTVMSRLHRGKNQLYQMLTG